MNIQAPDLAFPDIDFGLDDVPDLPHLLDELQKIAPAVRVKYGGYPAWIILPFAEVDAAFNDYDHFRTDEIYREIAEPSLGRTINMVYGDEHQRQKALVSGPFRPGTVRASVETLLEPVMNELLDEVEGCREFDLIEDLAKKYPFRVITRLMNIPIDDEDLFLNWAIKLLQYPTDPEGALAARAGFDAYIGQLIAQRRAQSAGDLISELIEAELDGEKLSDEEVATFCRILFPAGSDTTFKNIGSLFTFVLRDQSLRELAMTGDKARYNIVTECLRLEPTVALQPRSAVKEAMVGDVKIPRGDPVFLGVMSANRDPAVFPDPHRFDPERDNRQIMTFGRNAHFCLGTHLARRELETALKLILGRFPNMQFAPDQTVQIVGSSIRGPRSLRVYPYGEL